MAILEFIRQPLRARIQPILWKWYTFYSRKDRWHTYAGITVLVKPSVFHPGFLISTHVFVRFLVTQSLKEKNVLEIGTGSGLIALFCRQEGASVTATDINPAAVASVQESCIQNDLDIKVIASNLFEQIPIQSFDYILSNPPYFPKAAKDDREKAFYCGPEFEFFQTFFKKASDYLAPQGIIFMILSDDCDVVKIKSIAIENQWTMEEVHRVKKWGEWNMIYCIKKNSDEII